MPAQTPYDTPEYRAESVVDVNAVDIAAGLPDRVGESTGITGFPLRGARGQPQPYAPGGGPGIARSSAPRGMVVERDDGGKEVFEREPLPTEAQTEANDFSAALSSGIPYAERGERQPVRAEARGEVGPLIDELHVLFEQDRAAASQGGTTRCGICYLHFALANLEYREAEGYYVCRACARALGVSRLPMVRRQQRA